MKQTHKEDRKFFLKEKKRGGGGVRRKENKEEAEEEKKGERENGTDKVKVCTLWCGVYHLILARPWDR